MESRSATYDAPYAVHSPAVVPNEQPPRMSQAPLKSGTDLRGLCEIVQGQRCRPSEIEAFDFWVIHPVPPPVRSIIRAQFGGNFKPKFKPPTVPTVHRVAHRMVHMLPRNEPANNRVPTPVRLANVSSL